LGWTDVSRFAAAGIPAANFGPGDSLVAHTRDEHLDRASLERVHAALDDLLRRGV
jgi:succinyl-diaminopimelate desuccinylase